MKRFNRWLFVRLNKNEPTLLDAYSNIVSSWVAIVIWFTIGLCFILLPFGVDNFVKSFINYIKVIGAGLFLIVSSIYFAYWTIRDDKKSGLASLLKDFTIKRWHEKRKKYGLEE